MSQDQVESNVDGSEETNSKKTTNWRKEIIQLGLLGLLIFAFKSTFIGNYTVPTGSMEPTILPGDKIIANMMSYNLRIPFTDIILFELDKPETGDIVVFDYPNDRSISYVKRLIGKPGDEIEVEDGFIKLNGEKFKTSPENEDFLEEIVKSGGSYQESNSLKTYTVQREGHPVDMDPPVIKLVVPKGHYFFMGDNRDRSSDSREWGYVPFDHIKGKAKYIYFSSDSDPGFFTIPKRIRYERFATLLI